MKKVTLALCLTVGLIVLGAVLYFFVLPRDTYVCVGSADEPLIEIKRPDYAENDVQYEEIALNEGTKSNLSEVFQNVPELQNAAKSEGDIYTLVLSPQVTGEIADNMELLRTSEVNVVSVGFTGKVIDAVKKIDKDKIGSGVWDIVSSICVDQFMDAIDPQMAQVEKGLGEILEWLQKDKLTRLTGDYEYLSNIVTIIKNGSLNVANLNVYDVQLETVDRELIQIADFMMSVRADYDPKVMDYKINKLNIKHDAEILCSYIREYEQNVRASMYALYIRALGIKLKGAMPGNDFAAMSRAEVIERSVTDITNEVISYSETVKSKVPELKGVYPPFFKNKDAEIQQTVLDYLSTSLQSIDELTQQITQSLSDTKNGLKLKQEEFTNPLEIEVEVDDTGKVNKARKVKRELV